MLANVRIAGTVYNGVHPGRGAQLLRTPPGRISNVTLASGASFESHICDLRAGVLKFHPGQAQRPDKIDLDFRGLTIPCGWVAMDFFSFTDVRSALAEMGEMLPPALIQDAGCNFFMIPARYVHPSNSLFVPFYPHFVDAAWHGHDIGEHREHEDINNQFLFLKEGEIKEPLSPSNRYRHIVVSLIEGGSVVLKR